MQENHIYDIDRESEAHGYENAQPSNFDLQVAKDSFIPSVQATIETLLKGVEEGEINPLDVYAPFKKFEKLFKEAYAKIEEHAMIEANRHGKSFVFSGVEFSTRSGYAQYNYEEDDIYRDLKSKLEARKKLLDTVAKGGDTLYDVDGVEIPKVSIKGYTKDSLTVKFK